MAFIDATHDVAAREATRLFLRAKSLRMQDFFDAAMSGAGRTLPLDEPLFRSRHRSPSVNAPLAFKLKPQGALQRLGLQRRRDR